MARVSYLYRNHSRRSREEMATYLLAVSQKLYTALLLSTFGGLVLYLRDSAIGNSWFGELASGGRAAISITGLIVFYACFWGANRLRRYALQIWDDLEQESEAT